MKRIISIILSAAMVLALLPSFAFAANEAETISYVIKESSVKTDDFPYEHHIPMEEGKLSFSANSSMTAQNLDNNILNVVKNLSGNYYNDTSVSSLANSEISFVTYRPSKYYLYTANSSVDHISWTPVRHPANGYTLLSDTVKKGLKSADGTAVAYDMPATLNEQETAPFEVLGKSPNGSHLFFSGYGYYGTFVIGTYADPDSGFSNIATGTEKECSFALRIKIPENAMTGNYNVRFVNDFANQKNHYADENAARMDVYITEIGEDGFECKYNQGSGNIVAYTDKSGNTLGHDAYAADENKLSDVFYSQDGESQTFEDVRSFKAGAEYIIYFAVREDTADKTELAGHDTNNVYEAWNTAKTSYTSYQNFKLSQIDLIPVEEDVPATLASATVTYDKETKTASVTSAKMSDGTDATGYTVSYGMTGATNATINASTGVVTPGTEDETVTIYADVTLDGTTVRATLENVIISGYIPGQLKYVLSCDVLNDAAEAVIAGIDGQTTAADIRNYELALVSWKDITYKNTYNASSGKYTNTLKVAPGTEGAQTITNVLNTNLTDKFELPGRAADDNVPLLSSLGFYAQFVCRRFDIGETDPRAESYSAEKLTSRPRYMIKLYIPEKGAYKLSLVNNFESTSAGMMPGKQVWTEVHFAKADFDLPYGKTYPTPSESELEAFLTDENKIGWYDSATYGETTTYNDKMLIATEPGEYYISFSTTPESYVKNPNVYHRIIDTTVENEIDSARADYQGFALSQITLTPVSEDSDYTAAFDAAGSTYTTGGTATVNTYEYYTDGEQMTVNSPAAVTLGDTFTATAEDKTGYNFLYWAKGATNDKIIVSYSKKLSYKPQDGANHLIAVYEKADSEKNIAEFYNANGQRIKTLDADGVAPALPSLAGYGDANGWKLYGDESDKLYAAGEEITVAGTMIFVADYRETPITVTVNGTDVLYGQTVTLTASTPAGQVFKGWVRDGEIVSVNPTYIFKAWKDATITEIYADEKPVFSGKLMKISLSGFGVSETAEAIMAEFTGLDSAVEKGIIYNGAKVPMKSDGNQFTLEAESGTYQGYAIIKNADGTYTQITDGKYTK